MSNRLPFIAILAAIVLFFVYSSIFVVNEREQAVVMRFGEIVDVKEEPGVYFKLPFPFFEADNVRIIEDRILRFDLDDIRVQVSGGKFYEVDAFVAYNIGEPRRFMQAVSGSIGLVEQRLRTRLDAALRRVYGLRGFEAALSEERASMMREVRDQLRPAAESLGVVIDDVRIRRTDLTDEVSQQTYARMRAERLAEAERLRARGRESAARIRARADREVVEIRAAAQRESEILRGEGEAKSTEIFANAYQRDRDFFDFYRSMSAYRGALEPSGTTMLLSPNSEFFRYFKSPDGAPSTGTGMKEFQRLNETAGEDGSSGASDEGASGESGATGSADDGSGSTGSASQGNSAGESGEDNSGDAAGPRVPADGGSQEDQPAQ